mgnify:CR=1 FL=1
MRIAQLDATTRDQRRLVLLDGIRDGFTYPSTPDQAAFHEGFADVVVHGWLGCAHLLRAATATLTPDRWWLARYSVRYLQTLYPGEVRFGGDILGSGAGECTVNGWIKDAAGNLVTTAQLIFTDRLGQAVV